MVELVTLSDALTSLIYVLIIAMLISFLKPKGSALYIKYFTRFIYFKIACAIAFVLIHSYYYQGGDTFLYFSGSKFFSRQFIEQPARILSLLLSSFEDLSNVSYGPEFSIVYSLRSDDILYMSKFMSIFSLITFNQYLATNIIFTVVTGIGVWKLYETLCLLYPQLYKYFAIGILFYPSLGIWGSGILKDPLTLAAVGMIFKCIYNLANNKKLIISILIILLCIIICFNLKPYILYTFIPCMLLWLQGRVSQKVQNVFLKYLIGVFLIGVFSTAGYFFITTVSSSAGKYSLDNVQSVAEGFNEWHTYLSETRNQSGYSLGEVEYTIPGILEKAPSAFFVTYYRPFIIGDVRNVATLFEAIQTLILLILTVYTLVKVNPIQFFKIIISNSDVRAFMLFALIFGVAVGLTSYNFGALSRYKIPSLPFLTASLAIIYHIGFKQKKLKTTR